MRGGSRVGFELVHDLSLGVPFIVPRWLIFPKQDVFDTLTKPSRIQGTTRPKDPSLWEVGENLLDVIVLTDHAHFEEVKHRSISRKLTVLSITIIPIADTDVLNENLLSRVVLNCDGVDDRLSWDGLKQNFVVLVSCFCIDSVIVINL